MASLFFLLAGLYIVYKKEVKISAKRVIQGKTAEHLGALYVVAGLFPYVVNAIPTQPIQSAAYLLSLALLAIAILATLYLIIFYKSAS
jgi:hypothetical protein